MEIIYKEFTEVKEGPETDYICHKVMREKNLT